MGIDPSINGNAYAIIHPITKLVMAHKFAQRNIPFSSKIADVRYQTEAFFEMIEREGLSLKHSICCAIEQPEKQISARGIHAFESNKLVKLCAAFGAVVCCAYPTIYEMYTPTPSQWKGQVPKKITQKRIIKRYGSWRDLSRMNHDEMDAIALADWAYAKKEPVSRRIITGTGDDPQGENSS
jgi:hypothetical protein